MPNSQLPSTAPRAYLLAIAGGRYPWTVAPRTNWTLEIEASDLATAASVVSVDGSVEEIEVGDNSLVFVDRDGNTIATATVEVEVDGMGTDPVDQAGLADALMVAVLALAEPDGDLEGLLADASSDGSGFTIEFEPGENITVQADAPTVGNIVISHSAAITLSTLEPRRAFLEAVTREAWPYVSVHEAWPAGVELTLQDAGVANSEVLAQIPLDTVGQVEGATTLGRTDSIETDWDPQVVLVLGDDAAPTVGVVEVLVPFSPYLVPE